MDRRLSDMKQHQLDPKLALNREAWRNAVMVIDPENGQIRSAKVSSREFSFCSQSLVVTRQLCQDETLDVFSCEFVLSGLSILVSWMLNRRMFKDMK